MTPYILLIGAFERDNLGDLLFAKIFDRLLYPYSTVKGSLLSRDLTTIGGDIVVSVKDFMAIRKRDPLAVIHCGGETITNFKQSGVSMDLPQSIFKEDNGLYPFIEEEVSKKLSTSDNRLSYLYSRSDLLLTRKSNCPVAFTSIGGTSLNNFKGNSGILDAIKSKFESVKFLSVRDKNTKYLLKNLMNINSKLYPDVVHIISKTHPKEIRQASKVAGIRRIISGKPYILFQANSLMIEKYKPLILAKKLGQIALSLDKSLVFQPAGLASGHGSLELLEKIKFLVRNKYPKISVTVQKNRSIWEEVAIIANSTCSIGSSLHLRIISSSFNRPCVSLPIDKINSYVESWEIDNLPFNITPDKLPQAVEKAVSTDPVKLKRISTYFTTKVEEGLKDLFHSINLNPPKISSKKNQENPLLTNLHSILSEETDRLRTLLVKEILEKYRLQNELNGIKSGRLWKAINTIRKKTTD